MYNHDDWNKPTNQVNQTMPSYLPTAEQGQQPVSFTKPQKKKNKQHYNQPVNPDPNVAAAAYAAYGAQQPHYPNHSNYGPPPQGYAAPPGMYPPGMYPPGMYPPPGAKHHPQVKHHPQHGHGKPPIEIHAHIYSGQPPMKHQKQAGPPGYGGYPPQYPHQQHPAQNVAAMLPFMLKPKKKKKKKKGLFGWSSSSSSDMAKKLAKKYAKKHKY